METYQISLVPGPVSIPADVRAMYQVDYGSPDLEEEFFELYRTCEAGLQEILATRNQIVIMSGEGMLALWSALKSSVRPGDRVLAMDNGIFGAGIGEMASAIGAEVKTVEFPYDQIPDANVVRDAARQFGPKLITAVHCETPSGLLNPLAEVGMIAREVDALFYVDFVASGGGTAVLADEWQIDLGLLGSQKVLSLMADLAMITVSERAWEVIAAVDYVGYDALQPWRRGVEQKYLPYTHNWHALAGLRVAINSLLIEGLEACFARHEQVAELCCQGLKQLGIGLWPKDERYAAPTVTAAKLPDNWSWEDFDHSVRAHGLAVGGSYGRLAGRVFRMGHMGNQARVDLVQAGLEVIEEVLATKAR